MKTLSEADFLQWAGTRGLSLDPRYPHAAVLTFGALPGLPLGAADVVEFSRSELNKLVTLMFSTTVFGGSVGQDLYVVPDHGRTVLQTDHHAVIHVVCREPADIERWIQGMEDAGFSLPDVLPDSTFKTPDWLSGDE